MLNFKFRFGEKMINLKNLYGLPVVMAAMFVSHAAASDPKPLHFAKAKYEETIVTAQDLSNIKPAKGLIMVGLSSDVVLKHVYDKQTDTWKYVGAIKIKSTNKSSQ